MTQVDLYRKAGTLRKTKTGKADAKFIAQMLIATQSENPATLPTDPDIVELKALVRHRSRMKSIRTRLRISVSRLVTILFPELTEAVSAIHQASSYALLLKLPSAKAVRGCHLTKLTNLLSATSKNQYGKDKAIQIKSLAEKSIGSDSVAVGFELQQIIRACLVSPLCRLFGLFCTIWQTMFARWCKSARKFDESEILGRL